MFATVALFPCIDEIVDRLRELRPSIVLVTPVHLDVVTMCCGRDPRVKVKQLRVASMYQAIEHALKRDQTK